MQLNYSIQNNNIYDQHGREMPVDENGYVRLFIAGKECRFVKPLFIAWVNNNPHIKTIQPKPVKVRVARVAVKNAKPRKKQKERKKETAPRVRNGIKITAVNNNDQYGPFISLAACSKAIGITKSTISKIIKGTIINSSWSFLKL